MKIKWLGHSCFLLTSNKGVRILTDPFNHEVGYDLPAVEADIVTTSHGHYDHDSIEVVKGEFLHIDKPGKFTEGEIEIKGISTFHDEVQGKKRGNNIVFTFLIDGINICHCGDLGHVLTREQINEIGHVDILLTPIGGIYTIDCDGAVKNMKLLKPKITIPMHYKTPDLSFDLNGVNEFLTAVTKYEGVDKQEIELTKENLSTYSNVILLNYK